MALLDATSFVFDGHSSDEFDLSIGWFGDDNDDDMTTGLSVDLRRGEQNAIRTDPNLYGTVYEDTLRFEFALVPKCNSDRQFFTYKEFREINNWLRGSNTYKLLHFNDPTVPEQINYYAICTEIIDVQYDGRNGKKVTFVCNSPFGFTNKIHKTFKITDENPKEFKLYNMSDEDIYYPTIMIQVEDGFTDTISIENVSDDKVAVIDFSNLESNTVIMNSKQGKLIDENGKLIPAYKIGWDNTDNIYWFRLIKDWNTIKVIGISTVTFICEFPRKVGIL